MAWRALAQLITALENGRPMTTDGRRKKSAAARKVPVLGITGTGGAGKSSPHRRADPPPAPGPGRHACAWR
jgi:methylmalonyl-CoA mutase